MTIKRKGLSPVIATVLLITLALILAVIIFMWAKSFVSERVQKFDRDISYSCEDVSFDAEASTTGLVLENKGSVAMYGVKVNRVNSAGGSKEEITGDFNKPLPGGSTNSFAISASSGDSLEIIPKLLGQTENQRKIYTCEDKYGITISVS